MPLYVIERNFAEMIDEAEARRRHLADHLAGIERAPRVTRTGRGR